MVLDRVFVSNDSYILSHYKEVAENFGLRPNSSIEDLEIRNAEVLFIKQTLKDLQKKSSSALSVLELGSGNGYTLSEISPEFPSIQFKAIEFS